MTKGWGGGGWPGHSYLLFTSCLHTFCFRPSYLPPPPSYYRVVIGKNSNVPPLDLNYWSSQAQFNIDGYYVLYSADVPAASIGNTTVPSFTFSQTSTKATYNNVEYSVVAPEPGTYYLTVLLYSNVVSAFYLLPTRGLLFGLTFRTGLCLVGVSL